MTFNGLGDIATGTLWVEEPVYISWSRFYTVNHGASNYQLSNMKRPRVRFEPGTSEVESKHLKHYTPIIPWIYY